MAVTFYLRYRQVEEWSKMYSMNKEINKLNERAVRLALIAVLGVSIVANFQETNILSIHMLGAFLAFGFGQWYMILNVRFILNFYLHLDFLFLLQIPDYNTYKTHAI